jgi:putative transposase
MPRTARKRLWTEQACYHVLNRGHNRETVFADDADRRFFLSLLARYRQRFSARLYHYCLMGNHFHLLLQLDDPGHLSALAAGLLRSYVHYFNRRYGFVGHLWQGRFKSPAVQTEGYLLSCGRYIERNPLEAHLVEQPWEYPWSSCRCYALGEADPLLMANPWYEELAAEAQYRQQRWRELLLRDDPREAEVRQATWAAGADSFRGRLQDVRGRPTRPRRGRPRQARKG